MPALRQSFSSSPGAPRGTGMSALRLASASLFIVSGCPRGRMSDCLGKRRPDGAAWELPLLVQQAELPRSAVTTLTLLAVSFWFGTSASRTYPLLRRPRRIGTEGCGHFRRGSVADLEFCDHSRLARDRLSHELTLDHLDFILVRPDRSQELHVVRADLVGHFHVRLAHVALHTAVAA